MRYNTAMGKYDWWQDPLSSAPLPPWRYEDDKTAQRADSMFVTATHNSEPLGYWYDDVVERFGQNFANWMYGQTMAVGDGGRTVVYKHDVWQYMDGGKPLD